MRTALFHLLGGMSLLTVRVSTTPNFALTRNASLASPLPTKMPVDQALSPFNTRLSTCLNHIVSPSSTSCPWYFTPRLAWYDVLPVECSWKRECTQPLRRYNHAQIGTSASMRML
jgi:hypothetical protein